MSSQDVYSLYCKMSRWRKMELTDFLSSSRKSLASLSLRDVKCPRCLQGTFGTVHFMPGSSCLWQGFALRRSHWSHGWLQLIAYRQKKEEPVASLSSAQGSAIRRGTIAKGAYRLQGSEIATIWSRAKTHVHIAAGASLWDVGKPCPPNRLLKCQMYLNNAMAIRGCFNPLKSI